MDNGKTLLSMESDKFTIFYIFYVCLLFRINWELTANIFFTDQYFRVDRLFPKYLMLQRVRFSLGLFFHSKDFNYFMKVTIGEKNYLFLFTFVFLLKGCTSFIFNFNFHFDIEIFVNVFILKDA